MPTFTVDPTKFHGEAAVVNWDVASRRLGILSGNRRLGTFIELRWILSADMGLPTEPFVVWTRAHSATAGFQKLTFAQKQLSFAGGNILITWPNGPMAALTVDITASNAGTIFAFGPSPTVENIVAVAAFSNGTSTVQITGKSICSLLVPNGVTIKAVGGILPGGYANTPGWTQTELVGIPVSAASWSGIGKHGTPQGLVGSFSDAINAAVARLTRGAPPIGWSPNIAAGVPAPPWVAPDFKKLVSEVNDELLKFLHDVVNNFPPAQQAAQGVKVPLPPPKNSSGLSTNRPGTTTQLFPLPMTYMAAATDPFLSLALGFGTAYTFDQQIATVFIPQHDFMITAHWENGLDGKSAPADYAVVIPTPGAALAPPAPANMATDTLGALRPLLTDGDWRESVRLTWDRSPSNQLFRTVNCAAARVSVSPAVPAIALMQQRAAGGFSPIVVSAPLDPPEALDPEWWRIHVMDREIDIPSNPGSLQLKYGAAMQDIYGQWSPWSSTDVTITQTDLEPVRMSFPQLIPAVPASGTVCPATLSLDLVWDWRIRTPQQITITGRMYPAATHGTSSPNVVIPAGLDRALSGGGAALVITFTGDTPSAPGVTFAPLTEDGDSQAASFGSAQGTNRRYRMTLPGLSLDFGSSGFIGLALWARGQERIPPNRLTPFASETPTVPLVVSTGDPRPPVVPVFHVKLGSIPDASGSSHVQISWAAQQNAAGYFIYETTEANLLKEWGLPEPKQSDTLDARLLVIRENFKANPVRRPFHRSNPRALQITGTDIALPRGSTGIHLYVVLGISAGQVESKWPEGPSPDDALIAIAAPHITKPAPPMIEVQRFIDTSVSPPAYKAKLLVTTRPGPRPAMVELYRVRVDDAAREVDAMGPPLVRVQATSGPWNVTTVTDPTFGPYISAVTGVDAPPGSWKRVWYRATAWTKEDDTRGGLPGRSAASNAAWVVLPPADGPSITPFAFGGGAEPADVMIQWTCSSPLKRTPAGPHKISVRANVSGAAAPLILLDSTLDALPNAQPATGPGAWIKGTSAGVTTYRAFLNRAAITDVVQFAVRITDPLGRSGSQSATIAAGTMNPLPDLSPLSVQKVPLPLPAQTICTFASGSPVVAPLDGPYILKVTGVRTLPVLFPPPPSITEPLGSVPTKPPIAPTTFFVTRTAVGPPFEYRVVTTINLKGFVVRITGPDGKFVEHSI